jgi:hypothetical protein
MIHTMDQGAVPALPSDKFRLHILPSEVRIRETLQSPDHPGAVAINFT